MSLASELVSGVRRAAQGAYEAWRGPAPSPEAHPLAPVKSENDAPAPSRAAIAGWPMVDKYPVVLGSGITLQTISSQLRLATTGFRQTFVDLLRELIERDPHAYAVIQQRILTVASGRIDVTPAHVEDGSPDKELADKIASEVKAKILGIPALHQALAQLLWAIYFGPTAQEISWTNEGGDWKPVRLHFIHSRRLAYPDPTSWSLHIWDLGMVQWSQSSPTNRGMWGIRIEDYPGKFIVHTPELSGDYPTRDGIGREICFWIALKAMAARGAAHYIERFGKPWPVAYYASSDTGIPRAADDADIAKADETLRSLGAGSLAGSSLPDAIKIDIFGPGIKSGRLAITQDQFIAICNAEISKAAQGQTFTTETGKFGSRSTADVGQSSAMRLAAYDAMGLGESLRRDLATPIVKLNYPDAMHLVPYVTVHVEDEPDPRERLAVVDKAVRLGMPVDSDALADELGITCVPQDEPEPGVDGKKVEKKPRRLVPLAPMQKRAPISELEEPLHPEEVAAEEAAAAAAKVAAATARLAPSVGDAHDGDDPMPEAPDTPQKTKQHTNGVNGATQPAASAADPTP